MGNVKSLYSVFGTEKDLEVGGVWIDYKSLGTRIKIGRAGMKNTEYMHTFKKVMKRYNQIDMDALSDEQQNVIFVEIFAKAVIKAWEVKDKDNKWVSGIPLLVKNKVVNSPFSVENVKQILLDLPDLFADLRSTSDDRKTFQAEVEEAQLKN